MSTLENLTKPCTHVHNNDHTHGQGQIHNHGHSHGHGHGSHGLTTSDGGTEERISFAGKSKADILESLNFKSAPKC